jgi:hypothetical protein
MAYIGTKPTIGNFQICDAISVVNGQAAYTMQVGSVNVIPQSANHMIVSLNGVIQKPGSSFTVSGSTITFASNLATGDAIDFIQILGDVLDLGTPSDATVTTAKLAADAVTEAKIADSAVENEHLNVNVITGQTAETSIADGDTILIHDDSASALRKMTKSNFVSGIGGANTPIFSAKVGSTQTISNNSFTKIAFDTEEKDSDGAFDTSNNKFTVPSGKAGTYFLGMMMYTNPNNDQLVESYAMIYKNGSNLIGNTIFYGSSARPDADVQVVNGVVDLAVGDYIEGYVYSLCASSSSTRLFAGLNNTIFGYKLIT